MDVKSAKECISQLQEQILLSGTRCVDLKSQLDYMKMLYHNVHPEVDRFQGRPDASSNSNASCSEKSNPLSPKIPKIDSVQNMHYDGSGFYKYFGEMQNTRCISNEDLETPSSIQLETSLSKTDAREDASKKVESLDLDEENRVESGSVTSRTQILSQNNYVSFRLPSPNHIENMPPDQQDDNQHHHYQNLLAEYSSRINQDNVEFRKSLEQLISDNQREYFLQKLNFMRDDGRKDLVEHVSGSARTGQTTKRPKHKVTSSTLSSKKVPPSKAEDVISLKIRRKKGKLPHSNSKSTIATKDTNLIKKKDLKKRKQRGHATNYQPCVTQTESNKKHHNDVLEIYHNSAAKSGSNSIISSKRSKYDQHAGRFNIVEEDNVFERGKDVIHNYKETNIEKEPANDLQHFYHKNKAEYVSTKDGGTCNKNASPRVYQENAKPEAATATVFAAERCNWRGCQHAVIQAPYNDAMAVHNYEMPTLASKLKRTNRSYFSRFNFRSIPFVVGTSVTPSHNLGLNIQQVLSIMKTRQPTINGVTPLLIRKVSRGIQPVSILMEQINGHYNKLDSNSRMIDLSHQNGHPTSSKGSIDTDSYLDNQKTLLKYDQLENNETMRFKYSNAQYQCVDKNFFKDKRDDEQKNILCGNRYVGYQPMKNVSKDEVRKSVSQQNAEKPGKVEKTLIRSEEGDDNSVVHQERLKGIREVLVNLHDQFEEMNTKYERLQRKLDTSGDESVEKEIAALEKDLNVKESEINAVVSLYKEVVALKHQMKQLQEKSSFVCISTELSMNSNKAFSSLPNELSKTFTARVQQGYHARKEPSASIRLAGLLRQIQLFQKQLRLST